MKSIAKAFATLGLWNKVLLGVAIIAWAILTVALVYDWKSFDELVQWFTGQFSLAVAVSLIQITILINIWYKLGGTNTSLKHGEKERRSQDRRIHQNRVQIAEIRGELEIIKSIVIKEDETENRNMA